MQDAEQRTNGRRITVFGGSKCTPETEEYKEALKLGRLLVEAGFDVCSGGYAGVMEAISRGAHEAGGHVTGMTAGGNRGFKTGHDILKQMFEVTWIAFDNIARR